MNEDFYDDGDDLHHAENESRYILALNSIANAGVRDGRSKVEEELRQQGFDEGLALGIKLGELAGRVFGLARQAHKTKSTQITDQLVDNLGHALLVSLAEISSGRVAEVPQEIISEFPHPVQEAYSIYFESLNAQSQIHS